MISASLVIIILISSRSLLLLLLPRNSGMVLGLWDVSCFVAPVIWQVSFANLLFGFATEFERDFLRKWDFLLTWEDWYHKNKQLHFFGGEKVSFGWQKGIVYEYKTSRGMQTVLCLNTLAADYNTCVFKMRPGWSRLVQLDQIWDLNPIKGRNLGLFLFPLGISTGNT